jgi:transposase
VGLLWESGRTVSEAAETAEASVRCARKWVARYRAEREVDLLDHAAPRRARCTGPEIAETLGSAGPSG